MKIHATMTGYKATDKDMRCKGFQFKLGKWFKHDGEIKLCKKGFHFCVHPSGPWSYYNDTGTRIFKVEARNVHEEYTPGSDLKVVCEEIRFIEEIKPDGNSNTGNSNTGNSNTGNSNTGNSNTGDRNTGYSNTGYSNTGNRNTGYSNTGDWNTGYSNTGDWNTGYSNTGYSNTGYSNTGDWNTGYSNTGDRNTGNWNTGNWNTGNWNTGNWNTTNFSSGFFCQKEPLVVSFDKQTKLTRQQFFDKYPSVYQLGKLLSQDVPFDYHQFKTLPGWTVKKCKALHQAHINGRMAKNHE